MVVIMMPLDALIKLLPNFLFILLRAGIVLMLLPFFGSKNFPPQFKIGFAVAVALVLAPIVEFPLSQAPLPTIVVREVMFGMIFGLAARFIFFAVDMAGQVMGFAMGMSAATAFNPEIGPSTEVSQLYGIIAMLLFLAMDIHHDIIAVFVKSYEWLPAGTVSAAGLAAAGTSFVTKIFVIALKLSAPVAVIMLITNILFGFIYKVVPQMNVFFVGQPVFIFIGLLTMMLSLPVFAHVMGGYFSGIKDELGRVMLMMKG
jgi:flagellar biosynthetic protein FliR